MTDIRTIEELIESSRPDTRFFKGSTVALLGLSMLLGAAVADPDLIPGTAGLRLLLPQIFLIGIIVLIMRSARKQRRQARELQSGFEAVQLRAWSQAWEILRNTLQKPIKYRSARAESLLALAAVAEADQAYDSAQRIYESLLEENQGDPLQLHTARVALAGTLLRNGQTTDAVQLIEKLDRENLPDALRAQVELLNLYREITMGHAAERLDRAAQRRDLFRRYMGTRAGYGLGLLAAAFDRAGKQENARRFWHEATLLVVPSELIHRFAELTTLNDRYEAAAYPPALKETPLPSTSGQERP